MGAPAPCQSVDADLTSGPDTGNEITFQVRPPTGRLITSEIISVEIVRMLVGSIGLVLAVPITTGLAAVVLGPDDHTGHTHTHTHDHDHAHAHAQPYGQPHGQPPGTRPTERPPTPATRPSAPPTRGRQPDPWDDFTPNEWPW